MFLVYLGTTQSVFAHSFDKPMDRPLDKIEAGSKALAVETDLETKRATFRWTHAKELLGKHYKKSVVKTGEGIANLDDFLYEWTHRALKGTWKKASRAVSQAIIRESEKYGFDPVFLLAVIKSESSFNPEAIGGVGEIGLMQVTPSTAKWIAEKSGLPWKGDKSLKNPVTNIQIGAAYLAHLREEFDGHSQLYLAAYNMGSGNVQKALDRQVWPKEYPVRVMQNYVKYYTELKEELQEGGKAESDDSRE